MVDCNEGGVESIRNLGKQTPGIASKCPGCVPGCAPFYTWRHKSATSKDAQNRISQARRAGSGQARPPGRDRIAERSSAEGAARLALLVPRLRCSTERSSLTPASRPGLFSGGPSGLCFTTFIYDALYNLHSCKPPPKAARLEKALPLQRCWPGALSGLQPLASL